MTHTGFLRAHQPGGLKSRRQHAAGPYVLDFFCVDAGLAVGFDGSQHLERAGAAHDEVRDRYLARLGIRVLRFSNGDVLREPAGVVAAIIAAAHERRGRALTVPLP